jgi:ectoine hydroxylase-related dioxygenase (phytanoyl-CoA dioxygenase family)
VATTILISAHRAANPFKQTRNTQQHSSTIPWPPQHRKRSPYYNITGDQNVTFWIPVDSVPKQASLEFVVGSHGKDMPWYMPRTFVTKEAKWFPEGSLPELPKVDRAAAVVSSWALEPGDVVAFHMQTIHGSAGTPSRRRALAARYVGDDVRHVLGGLRLSFRPL